jgi:glucose-1-phosphate cytidylyltransferase
MNVVILAGGLGTRLSEETTVRPKPMVEVGGKPLLWHIMRHYAAYAHRDFFVACGYKGEMIKEYFRDFALRNSDFHVELKTGSIEVLNPAPLDWRVTVLDTGFRTMTGGRVLRLRRWLESGTFMVTYGDGVSDVDIDKLIAFHRSHGRIATVTAVRPPARFGGLILDGARVREFSEKPQMGEGWINGGFFVFEPRLFDYIAGDNIILEREPLEKLATAGELMAFFHEGFWQPMDTLREKMVLEDLWTSGRAPWAPRNRPQAAGPQG